MILLFIVSLSSYFAYYLIKNTKSLHMLQQNWYNDSNRYLFWLLKNPIKVFINPDMFFILFVICSFINFEYSTLIFFIFYFICILLYLKAKKTEQVKKPLAYTKRIKRLIMTSIIIMIIVFVTMCLNLDESNIYIYYLLLGLINYLNYFVMLLVNIINKPIEKLVYIYYKKKAKNKLKNMTNLNVIGITGSYGKTSSKNILNDILSSKFDTCPTPKNFNTPNGLMITINNYLDKFSDVFIAEMGAFKVGEIKELCDFVKPKYGILTKIGTAHMESFGSQENIQKTKFELIESLPSNGCGILNGDDPLQLSYKLKNDCNILWIGIENHDVDLYAENIKMDYKGMSFDCVFKGDKNKYHFETKLLGKANVYNILAGVLLGNYLGISKEQLIQGVKKVNKIEHRLELKKYMDINILDDAYNSNPVGSKMALDVLNLMPGKKIIVTPGMIELGEKQFELNMEFGEYIANICDEVILVGEDITKPIYKGLMNKNYDVKKIHIINDVKVAFKLMHELKDKETYVLLENDLPDIFNE